MLAAIPQAQVLPCSQNLPGSEINIQSKRAGPKANVHSDSNPPSYAHMQLKLETNNEKKNARQEHIRPRTKRALVWDIIIHLFVQTSLSSIF